MYVTPMTRPIAVCAATVILFLFAPGSYAAPSPRTDGWPDWLREAMAKESGKLRASKVAVGDGFFKSRLAGKVGASPQPMDGGWYLTSDIGTPSPLECWIFSDAVDPATMAANIADATIQATEQLNGPVGNRSIYFVDAGAYRGAAYLALEWLYTVGEAPKALAGLAKVRVAMKDDVTLACAHNFLGYRETFARAFEDFVNGADITAGGTPNYYEELIVQKIGQQPVGVSRLTFTLDDDGDTEIQIVESSLFPVDASTLSTSDTWHSSYSRADGTLINQRVAKSENGELTMFLELDPTDDGTWWLSGTYQGKDLNQALDGTMEPLSEVGQMRAVQNMLASDGKNDVKLNVWVPSADPTQFLQASVAMDPERRKDGYGTLTLGPLSIAAQFDKAGSMLNGRMQAGAMEMLLERIWVHGTPP